MTADSPDAVSEVPTRRAPDAIRTPRLLGVRLTLDHEALFMGLHRDRRVVRWLGAGEDEEVSAADNREWLNARIARWDEHGFGQYALFETDAPDAAAGRFAGRAGLQQVDADVGEAVGDPRTVELMYAFAHHAWGRGLATEIAGRLLNVARDDLGLSWLLADTVPHNLRSRGVMKRAGFVHMGEFWHDDHWMVWYRKDLV